MHAPPFPSSRPLARLLALLLCLGSFQAWSRDCTSAETTVTCCLKLHPGEYQRCTGLSYPELATGTLLVTAVITLPHDERQTPAQGEALDEPRRLSIEQVLAECAKLAEQEGNELFNNKKKPSEDQCKQQHSVDRKGKPVTWAMYLGIRKHELALICAKERLGKLIPGRFSVEPRYRYNVLKHQWEALSAEDVDLLLKMGGWTMLEGTVAPDIIIHTGNPNQVQAVYDFKFPCPCEKGAAWYFYKKGEYWEGWTQNALYQQIFGRPPMLVSPTQGVRP